MLGIDALVSVLGSSAGHADVQALLGQIQANKSAATVEPEVKAYPDVVYHNYKALGLSLQYEAATPGMDASKCSPRDQRLAAIDIYSGHDDTKWTCFPALPLSVHVTSSEVEITIKHDSKGKDLVNDLGEPQRKGGGAGDRSGPAAWMEWSLQLKSPSGSETRRDFKMQVELAGAAARGANRWNAERAGTCNWAVLTIS
ncbi:uncharacterized protein SRS1_14850 [Sporisorium reilianum f. sp. reilianum]|uniref:Uncharacterized protein n=1 Tax=Sporisorium reilianum f. sp. reilianum TaxID=72559 RepID=A0A2N8UGW3_9BASI|nr:uncharacterized protein SRS1_14850 [Sporisorium reilianum f. sp. reilianum]